MTSFPPREVEFPVRLWRTGPPKEEKWNLSTPLFESLHESRIFNYRQNTIRLLVGGSLFYLISKSSLFVHSSIHSWTDTHEFLEFESIPIYLSYPMKSSFQVVWLFTESWKLANIRYWMIQLALKACHIWNQQKKSKEESKARKDRD